jgi:hypothetical protein
MIQVGGNNVTIREPIREIANKLEYREGWIRGRVAAMYPYGVVCSAPADCTNSYKWGFVEGWNYQLNRDVTFFT